MILIAIIFWISVAALLHSYLFYPLILRLATVGKKPHSQVYDREETLPQVSLLMSAFNEEKVIAEKINSILASDYPPELLHIFIGSDCSSDKTDEIIEEFILKNPDRIHFSAFDKRQGKPMIINQLSEQAFELFTKSEGHILIITDANVMLGTNTVFELCKHFKDSKIALVDSNIVNPDNKQSSGIGKNEKGYISREVLMKHREGLAWGAMIGPLGGCYAIRSTYFSQVPKGFLVDDFYIAMNALKKGGKAINELNARCFEDVSNRISEEFRRKTRISSGNFANLSVFWPMLFPWKGAKAFAFLSHKVLRWLGPFFIFAAFTCNVFLAFAFGSNLFYQILFFLQTFGLFAVPLLDFLTGLLGLHLAPLRYVTYFLAMNLALLKGFFNYLKGVRNNVWQPTQRNID
jgi:cellulose synthase/poly-beta-1,6-N-acetylglucosamine synthase-like glycosyltransferase